MKTDDRQLLAEVRALRDDVRTLTDLIAGPKSGRRFVSGAAAARLLGISYPTFKVRYVTPGMIRPQCGDKFELKQVKNLREA